MVHGREGELSEAAKGVLAEGILDVGSPMHVEDGVMVCGGSPWLQLCLKCQHQICDLHNASIIAAHEDIHCCFCHPENHTAWAVGSVLLTFIPTHHFAHRY